MDRKIEIPEKLRNENFRFIRLSKDSKVPIPGVNWKNNLLKFNNKELLSHLESGGNYGVVGGGGNLRIIDLDEKDFANIMLRKIETFTVKTCGGNYHLYIISPYNKNNVFKNNLGEFRADNYYTVGPTCYVIDEKKNHIGEYTVTKDIELKVYEENEILELFSQYLKESDIKDSQIENITVDKDFLDKKVIKFLKSDQIKKLITQETDKETLKLFGFPSRSERDAHVITHLLLNGHGKYIKSIFENYPIGDKYRTHTNKDKYLEHSIKTAREYSGVGEDLVIELENEIERMQERVLRNKVEKYLEKIGKVKSNLHIQYLISALAFKIKINKTELLKKLKEIKSDNQEVEIDCVSKMKDEELPRIKYLIDNLIPENSVILIGGKPGQFKSMLLLYLSLNMRENRMVFSKFMSNKTPKILYYDLENGKKLTHTRIQYLNNELNIKWEELNNMFFKYDFKRDNIDKEMKICNDYDVIVLDSYRRFLKGSENESDVTDAFFNDFIRPLKDKGKTIMIIHHLKKGNQNEIDDEDLDVFRGSGDFVAEVDMAYKILKSDSNEETNSFLVSLIPSKNRLGIPIKNFTFSVFKDDSNFKTILTFNNFKKMQSKTVRTREKLKLQIIEYLQSHKIADRSEIVKLLLSELGTTKSDTPDRYLRELLEEGILTQPVRGKYSLKVKTENISNNNNNSNDSQLHL
jgi:RecA-family ATPase